MNLIIDQGNTYSKLAFFEGSEIVAFRKEENTAIGAIQSTIKEHPVKRAIIASVADASAIIDILNDLQIPVISVDHKSALPITLDYETPETLGLDRIAAAVGAYSQNNTSASLIIDIGTAVTYDICTADGQFIGGSIAPGLDMRLQALHNFTERLPLVYRQWGENEWAKSTPQAIRNGAQEGILAEINHYIDKAKNEFKDISVFLTGGDAIFFEKKIKNDIFVSPNLLLEGLFEILKIN